MATDDHRALKKAMVALYKLYDNVSGALLATSTPSTHFPCFLPSKAVVMSLLPLTFCRSSLSFVTPGQPCGVGEARRGWRCAAGIQPAEEAPGEKC